MLPRCLAILCLTSAAFAQPRTDQHGDPLPDGAIARFGTVRYRIGTVRTVWSFAVSPDVKSLAAEDQRGISIWDLETGRPRLRFKPSGTPDRNAHYALCFSTDGSKLARLGGQFVNVYEAKTGSQLLSQDLTKANAGRAIAFSFDDKRLFVVADHAPTIFAIDVSTWRRLQDTNTDQPIWRLLPHKRFALRLSPGGLELVGVGSGTTICRFEGTKFLTDPDAALSPDDQRLYVTDRTGRLQTFDCATGKRLEDVAGPSGWGESRDRVQLSLSPDGATAYLTKNGQTIRRRDLQKGTWLESLPRSVGGNLVIRPDGSEAVLVGSDGVIHRYDLKKRTEILTPAGFEDCVFAYASPAGGRVLVQYEAAAGYKLDLFDLNGKQLWSQTPTAWESARWSRDGRWLACIGRDTITVRDAATGKVARVLRSSSEGRAFSHVFLPDVPDRLVAAIEYGRAIAEFDLRTGRELGLQRPGIGGVMSLTPDGDRVIYAPEGKGARLFELPSNRFLALPEEPLPDIDDGRGTIQPPEVDYRFSPDGSYLISIRPMGQAGRLVVVRDPGTLQTIRTFKSDLQDAFEFALSADGLWLTIGQQGGAITLFDVPTGAKLGRWEGHKDYITSIGFVGAGRVLTGSADLTALLWELRPDKLQATPSFDALSSSDGQECYRAIWAFASDPKAPELLRTKIAPAGPIRVGNLKEWITDLGSNRYATRESATRNLRNAGRAAEPLLREARRKPRDEEVLARVDALLAQVRQERSPNEIVQARAVAAMEISGSESARKLLAEWASGAPGARLTIDAKAALQRLPTSR